MKLSIKSPELVVDFYERASFFWIRVISSLDHHFPHEFTRESSIWIIVPH